VGYAGNDPIRRDQQCRLTRDHNVAVLVEVYSPEGYWGERARVFAVGQPSEIQAILDDAFADHSGLFGQCVLQFAERMLCYCEDIAFL
jgi:hypothetical protein